MSNCGCCITATCIFESIPPSCADCDRKDLEIKRKDDLIEIYKKAMDDAHLRCEGYIFMLDEANQKIKELIDLTSSN